MNEVRTLPFRDEEPCGCFTAGGFLEDGSEYYDEAFCTYHSERILERMKNISLPSPEQLRAERLPSARKLEE